MNNLISLYIDDELSLDEKIDFVCLVHDGSVARDEAVDLLEQEKALKKTLALMEPAKPPAPWWRINIRAALPKMAGFAAAAGVIRLIAFMLRVPPAPHTADTRDRVAVSHRFVLYKPSIEQAEISGTFTDWERVPLKPAGSSGYWEVTLPVPAGEHRYVFILNGGKQIPDHTAAMREKDDFGASNSNLSVEV